MSMFSFNVGENEFHTVGFEFSRLTGRYKATVDGLVVIKGTQIVIGSREIKFEVGGKEKHKILIRWKIKYFGSLRKIETNVYVDEKLQGTYFL